MRFLILIATLSATTANAQEIISCEARTVSINNKTMESMTYDKIYPTIIISDSGESLSYFYTQHGMQWKHNFAIKQQNEDRLLGIENLQEMTIHLFHYDKSKMIFNMFYSSGSYEHFGGEITTGKCFNWTTYI